MWEFDREIFRELIDKYGAETLAKRLSVSKGTVYNWSKTHSTPSIDMLIKISNELNVHPVAFFTNEDEEEYSDGKKKIQTKNNIFLVQALQDNDDKDVIEIENAKTKTKVLIKF